MPSVPQIAPAPAAWAILAVGLVVTTSGCAPGRDRGDDGAPGVPASVEVVRNPATGAWEPGEGWRLVEDLRVGRMDGSGPEVWGSVVDVAVDGLGRLYVLDNQALEIRVFDADGRYVRTIGREGRGPGEIELSAALLFSPRGNLWVHDARNQRFTVFDTAGDYLGEHPIRTARFVQGHRFADDGSLLELVALPGTRTGSEVLVRSRLAADGSLQPVDTFPLSPLPRARTVIVRSERGTSVSLRAATLPFTPPRLRVLDPRGYVWTTATDGDYRLVQQRLSGDTVRLVERAYDPVEVTPEERSRALEPLAGADVDEDRIPTVQPPIEALAVSGDGHLWVWRHVAAGRLAWDVFEPGGRYLGEVDPPPGSEDFRLLEVAPGALYGVARDELDVSYVVRLRIEGGGAG